MSDASQRRLRSEQRKQRAALLHWASGVSGLPLRHVSEVQNGAVFCYIISLICDLDLSLVNYDAQEECECLANYRLLQTVAKARRVRGLNHKAKLAHWGRLASCEDDAWEFLGVLKRVLAKAGRIEVCADIEADATPPPPPVYSKQGLRRQTSQPHPIQHRPVVLTSFSTPALPMKTEPERVRSLSKCLFGSEGSDDAMGRNDTICVPLRDSMRSLSSERELPRTASCFSGAVGPYFERNLSGAVSVYANEPPSPHSSVSEQERQFSSLMLDSPSRSWAA